MITIFKNILNIIQLDAEEPLVVLEDGARTGKVTDTVSAVLAGIIQAEESRGHLLKDEEARLLDLETFKERVRTSRFVVVVEDSMPGSGIVIRLDYPLICPSDYFSFIQKRKNIIGLSSGFSSKFSEQKLGTEE